MVKPDENRNPVRVSKISEGGEGIVYGELAEVEAGAARDTRQAVNVQLVSGRGLVAGAKGISLGQFVFEASVDCAVVVIRLGKVGPQKERLFQEPA